MKATEIPYIFKQSWLKKLILILHDATIVYLESESI